jgi:hypothetical protein
MISIGTAYETEQGLTGMRISSQVVIHDREGSANDDWINDYALAKIGDGGGTWTFMRSQGHLLLWGKALEFVARFKDFSPNSGRVGTVELAKPLNGSRTLSYEVRPL